MSGLQRPRRPRLTEDFGRYDYDGDKRKLVFRMPTGVHELFIDGVEDAIRSQLKAIRNGSGSIRAESATSSID